MAIVLTRDTVGVCCCTASSDSPSVVGDCTTCSANDSGEGSEVNMSARQVSFIRYLILSTHGDGACTTCFIGGSVESTEVNTLAKKVSFRRYLSFSSQEDTKLLASSHASLAESSVYSTMSDNCAKVADSWEVLIARI